ncbi:MAG: hypothetical protein ACU85U_11765 [Gammaproteobacteria bacterium]
MPARFTRLAACWLGLLLGCGVSTRLSADKSTIDYRITTDPHLASVSVDLCFQRSPLAATLRATAALSSAITRISAVAADGRRTPLEVAANTVYLPRVPFKCINYVVSLPQGRTDNRRADVHRHNGAVMISLDRILLRPAWQQSWQDTRLSFDLPDGIEVAAPGRDLATTSARRVFALQVRPHDWHGDIVLGRLVNTVIDIQGKALRVTVVGDASATLAVMLRDWVGAGARTVAGLYGRFPVDDVQVLVIPLGRNTDPVPWGEVVRGGGDTVHLYVDGSRRLDELNANWVLCHELSHLLHPYVTRGGSWLPEGIASYYQNVLRARTGMLEPAVAWEKLESGFKRGLQQTTGKQSLADATGTMMRNGQYMRVYWSGAAIALIADVELRRQTNGAMSLDRVLDELARCCLPTQRRWRPEALMAKLDAIGGTGIFMRLYAMYVAQPVFPDVRPAFNALGLGARRPADGNAAALAAADLRRAIMGGD